MSKVVSTSQPLATFWSQSEYPGAQMAEHTLAVQVGSPFGNGLHALPHLPQFAGSAEVTVSHPLTGVLSQSSKPAMHDAMMQRPSAQPAEPLVTGPQATPHAPQWVTSLAGFTHTPPQHSEPPPSLAQSTLPTQLVRQVQVLLICWHTCPAGQLSLTGKQVTHTCATTSQRGNSPPQSRSDRQRLHAFGLALQSASVTEKSRRTAPSLPPPPVHEERDVTTRTSTTRGKFIGVLRT